MQYILTEHEMNLGCELVESFESEEMNLDLLYFEQESLNQQGYFTVIHCTDVEKIYIKYLHIKENKYMNCVFQRKENVIGRSN